MFIINNETTLLETISLHRKYLQHLMIEVLKWHFGGREQHTSAFRLYNKSMLVINFFDLCFMLKFSKYGVWEYGIRAGKEVQFHRIKVQTLFEC